MKNQYSMKHKILRAMISIVFLMVLSVGIVLGITMRNVTKTLIDSNKDMARISGDRSSSSMSEVIRSGLLNLAYDKADLTDRVFYDFEATVKMAATAAQKIYRDESDYSPREVPLPDASNDGNLTLQVLFSANTNPEDPAVRKELGLLGNIQETLYALNDNNENMASIYYASESGFMIQADYIPAKKYDDAGNLMPLEAKERPWYIGARLTGAPFFTPVTKDAHTTKYGIMCGVPVYSDGRLTGVAGAGMYLDDVETMVQNVDIGESGNAFILNKDGQVLFSTYAEGSLSVSTDGKDLRDSDDKDLRSMATNAVAGRSGVDIFTIDGTPYYAAYAPMETVGWSFFLVLTQEEVDRPTKALQENLNVVSDQAIQETRVHIRRSIIVLLLVIIVAVILTIGLSLLLSKRIVRPIEQLTEEVSRVEGDNLNFTWDPGTGDETQLLADSFRSLTGRMQTYIDDLQRVTGEKERIGAELNIATRIQEGMLPDTFPAYPDRSEFDIFARMDPAKEVGGDFYDFYLIDDDHLGLVMADVCGKGVPAALFMMASKIILANNAKQGMSPAKVLHETNNAICANNKMDLFVTVWFGILEISTGKITAANAGHEYPVLCSPEGIFELVDDKPHGFAVGGFPDEEYNEYVWQLEPGQKLFLYTDGVAEAMNQEREQFGIERMLEVLNNDQKRTSKETLMAVRTSVDSFVGGAEQFDDLTMLCLEYHGKKS